MSSPGSVSPWIAALKGGDPAAAFAARERYYRRLVALARKKLQSARRRAALPGRHITPATKIIT